jgi:hypothetical protein
MINRFNVVMRAIITVAFCLNGHLEKVFAARDSHLLPVAPFFDTQGEYARQYAEICEKMLFPAPEWRIRYYEVIANPSATMGVSIYGQGGHDHYIDVRQSTPELKSVIEKPDYETRNLHSIYSRVKVEKAKKKVPATTASEIAQLWFWSLSEVGPMVQEGNTIFMDAPLIILYAKKEDGAVLAGKFPPDHQGIAKFVSFRAIVAKVIRACDATAADRQRLFTEVEQSSRKLREQK